MITLKKTSGAQGKSLRARALAVASSLALATSALVVVTSPQVTAADTYAVPAAPKIIRAYATDAGIRVRFETVTANPAVTNYVVSGGQGSCQIGRAHV